MSGSDPVFTFEDEGCPTGSAYEVPKLRELLQKWGLLPSSYLRRFRFTVENSDGFKLYQKDAFLQQLMASGIFHIRGSSSFTAAGGAVNSVSATTLRCDNVSTDVFDVFREDDAIVREETDRIVKCMDIYMDEVTLSDRLQECLWCEESEVYDLLSEGQRSELLIHILKRLVLGGSLNQYEDEFSPYENMASQLYRDLVRVGKDRETNRVFVTSHAFEVTDVAADQWTLFPSADANLRNFCYVTVDPKAKTGVVWYHAAAAVW